MLIFKRLTIFFLFIPLRMIRPCRRKRKYLFLLFIPFIIFNTAQYLKVETLIGNHAVSENSEKNQPNNLSPDALAFRNHSLEMPVFGYQHCDQLELSGAGMAFRRQPFTAFIDHRMTNYANGAVRIWVVQERTQDDVKRKRFKRSDRIRFQISSLPNLTESIDCHHKDVHPPIIKAHRMSQLTGIMEIVCELNKETEFTKNKRRIDSASLWRLTIDISGMESEGISEPIQTCYLKVDEMAVAEKPAELPVLGIGIARLFNNYSQFSALALWLAFYEHAGVSKIFMYQSSCTPEVEQLLQLYQDKRLVVLLDGYHNETGFTPCITNPMKDATVGTCNIEQRLQVLQVIPRAYNHVQLLAIIDQDEFVLPIDGSLIHTKNWLSSQFEKLLKNDALIKQTQVENETIAWTVDSYEHDLFYGENFHATNRSEFLNGPILTEKLGHTITKTLLPKAFLKPDLVSAAWQHYPILDTNQQSPELKHYVHLRIVHLRTHVKRWNIALVKRIQKKRSKETQYLRNPFIEMAPMLKEMIWDTYRAMALDNESL